MELKKNSGITRMLAVLLMVSTGWLSGCANDSDDDETVKTPVTEEHDHELDDFAQYKAGRLVVADRQSTSVYVFDLESSLMVNTFEMGASNTTIYAGGSRRYAYAVKGGANGWVKAIDSGLILEDHGDHAHRERQAPALLSFQLTGDGAAHFVPHGETIIQFFDGISNDSVKARFAMFKEGSFSQVTEWKSTTYQHGVAVPWQDNLVVTTFENGGPSGSGYALPKGVKALEYTGGQWAERQSFIDGRAGETGCVELHGEASTGNALAFGCGDGVLLLNYDTNSKKFSATKLAEPDSEGSFRRAGTLWGTPKKSYLLANYGAASSAPPEQQAITPLLKLTLGSAPALTRYETGGRVCAFAGFEPTNGNEFVYLTADGALRILNPETMSEKAKISLFPAFTATGTSTNPCSGFLGTVTIGPRYAYVSDPSNSRVFEINLEKGQNTRILTFPSGSQPRSLAVMNWFSNSH